MRTFPDQSGLWSFLLIDYGKAQPTVGGTIFEQVGLACEEAGWKWANKEAIEQPSKQNFFMTLALVSAWDPALVSLHDGVWPTSASCNEPVPPLSCF